MKADWKSAEEIEADVHAGQSVPLQQLVLDLWRRVDELQRRVWQLENAGKPN